MEKQERSRWEFSDANIKSLNGHPIFIDFTADLVCEL